MNPLLNEIAQRLTGRAGFDDTSVDEWARMANPYPAFATAQIMAALRQADTDPMARSRETKARIFLRSGAWASQVFQKSVPTGFKWTSAPAETSLPDQKPEIPVETTIESTAAPALESLPVNKEIKAPVVEVEQVAKPEPASTPAPKEEKALLPTDTLSFEPYHTVDYFASQGIRFRDEPQQKDKFSVQLRSFTDWLKTMKRLPATETVAVGNASEEKKVVQMAETSLAPREVLTETMAEVWEKQGDLPKAIRIYEKLSLLDPGKSAYFAAKIEHLKQS